MITCTYGQEKPTHTRDNKTRHSSQAFWLHDKIILMVPFFSCLPVKVFIPETSSSTDVRVSSVHLPDSSSVAQSTSVSSVSTVTQSVLVSESAQVLVHSSAVSDGAMMVSDSTASTSSDLGSAIDKIIESTIGPDIMNGIFTDTPLCLRS